MQVSSIHCFIRCFIHSFLHSFTHSLTQSVNQSLAHSFTYLTHLDSARLRSTPPQSGQVKSSHLRNVRSLTSSPIPPTLTHSPIRPFTHSPAFTYSPTRFTRPSTHFFHCCILVHSLLQSLSPTHSFCLLTHSRSGAFSHPAGPALLLPSIHSSSTRLINFPFAYPPIRCVTKSHTYPRAFSSTLPPPQRCLLATPFGPGLLNRRSAGSAQKTSGSKMCKLATDVILPGHAHVSLTTI